MCREEELQEQAVSSEERGLELPACWNQEKHQKMFWNLGRSLVRLLWACLSHFLHIIVKHPMLQPLHWSQDYAVQPHFQKILCTNTRWKAVKILPYQPGTLDSFPSTFALHHGSFSILFSQAKRIVLTFRCTVLVDEAAEGEQLSYVPFKIILPIFPEAESKVYVPLASFRVHIWITWCFFFSLSQLQTWLSWTPLTVNLLLILSVSSL